MRLTLATALLLGSVTLAHAGQVILGWDYPLAWQQGTTYVLRITTLQRGLPTGTTRTMAPFTPAVQPVAGPHADARDAVRTGVPRSGRRLARAGRDPRRATERR